jgi:dinuclear metal center YbgI/SA1388 family protein
MKIKELIAYIESVVPTSMQESYDNCGLLCGNESNEISGVLISLDCIEAIVDEAIDKKCNLIISHHPILFKGIRSLTGKNYIERTLLKAIQNNISLYAIHTNLDNYQWGVNHKIAEVLGIQSAKMLVPKTQNLCKLCFFVPNNYAEKVRNALFSIGAGAIGQYDACSFSTPGEGTFRPLEGANPFVGEIGNIHHEQEIKIELLVSQHQLHLAVQTLKAHHPYEEVAYDIIPLLNKHQNEGAGMYGILAEAMDENDFLLWLKSVFKCSAIRHTKHTGKKIQKIAFCGGSGFFLLNHAKNIQADAYITADIKYHEFFDADNELLLVDIGHFESEQFTIDLLKDFLIKKFTTFAVHLTKINTNPINYL